MTDLREIMPEKYCNTNYNEAIDDCYNAIKDKVILKEDLLSENDILNLLWKYEGLKEKDVSNSYQQHMRKIAQAIVKAQNEKVK